MRLVNCFEQTSYKLQADRLRTDSFTAANTGNCCTTTRKPLKSSIDYSNVLENIRTQKSK